MEDVMTLRVHVSQDADFLGGVVESFTEQRTPASLRRTVPSFTVSLSELLIPFQVKDAFLVPFR